MTEESPRALLLGFYLDHGAARTALQALRHHGVRRVIMLRRTTDGSIHVDYAYRRQRVLWTVSGALLGALLAGLALGRAPHVGPSISLAASGLLAAAMAFVAFRISWRYRVDLVATQLERHERWLVDDEAVVIAQAEPDALSLAVTVLRRLGEPQPSIFVLRPTSPHAADAWPVDVTPLGIAQLEARARRLAEDLQTVTPRRRGANLLERIASSASVIEQARAALAAGERLEQSISPSAEWLLDNAYILREHVSNVQQNLSRRFYGELPVVDHVQAGRSGPQHAGEPRVFALAEELVHHTDGHVDRHHLAAFLTAYQTETTLRIGELWALPLMLRIALIERVRGLAQQVEERMRERESADFWAYRLRATVRRDPRRLFDLLAEIGRAQPSPSPYFAAQLTARLRDEDAALIPVQSWLERTLRRPLAEVIQREQMRRAAFQVSMGHAVTSLRHLSVLDWRKVFEEHCSVEHILRTDPAQVYHAMDFDTRDRYRGAVEELANLGGLAETVVAREAISLAASAQEDDTPSVNARHVGWHLIGAGQPALWQRLHVREPWRRRARRAMRRAHTPIYLGAIAVTAVLLYLPLAWLFTSEGAAGLMLVVALLAALLPASQQAEQIVHYFITRIVPPRLLPKMSYEDTGIPDAYRTLVAVPMLLESVETVSEEIEKLEIRFLGNPDSNLRYALLADYIDADRPTLPRDAELRAAAVEGIERLNRKYGEGRFFLILRERVWTESEQAYLGWERKRGKLAELNAAIAGEEDRAERIVEVGDPRALFSIRFVLTLDSDTQLPRDSARRLVETLAHPLNAPWGDGGYTIIQPRVSTWLPSATATPFSRLFSDPVGVDPYTQAVSDVYQDLTGEGSYIGKGLYDARRMHDRLSGRFPAQRLLSHDLIEGAHVRVALASDIEVFEESPPDYTAFVRRMHRWIRGDWQIAEWCGPRVPAADGSWTANPLSVLNRWKIFDNLRRSLVPVGVLVLLVVGWLLSSAAAAVIGTLIALMMLFAPTSRLAAGAVTTNPRHGSWRRSGRELVRAAVEVVLLPHRAMIAIDAILRVLYRRLVSGRRLLEWTTARVAARESAVFDSVVTRHLLLVSLFAIGTSVLIWWAQPTSLAAASPFLALWLISPLVGRYLNMRPKPRSAREVVGREGKLQLRGIARKTWRYYDDLVGEDTQWLPPDNFQVSHTREIAMRTSPTNIGMWILSALAACDFGYLVLPEAVARLRQTFATMEKVERHRGHLLNWYDLWDLSALRPRYVSTVDSGNLLGCIWTLEHGLLERLDGPPLGAEALEGLADTLVILRGSLIEAEHEQVHVDAAEQLLASVTEEPPDALGRLQLLRRVEAPARRLTEALEREVGAATSEPCYWAGRGAEQIRAWLRFADDHLAWLEPAAAAPEAILARLDESERGILSDTLESPPSIRKLSDAVPTAVRALLEVEADDVEADDTDDEVAAWRTALADACIHSVEACRATRREVDELVAEGRTISDDMPLDFLYDGERRLFSTGLNVDTQELDGSYYDLLASEARLASFIAVARGEAPTEHWMALGRPFGVVDGRRVLLSWSGTMFEYLMPLLLQRPFDNSLLDMAARAAVVVQRNHGRRRGVPWGVSESAYAELDASRTYQYKAFGVPGLGLQRGLGDDLVVAPYATLLALQFEPEEALRNLDRLADYGMFEDYGFFEALDFSRRREREGERGVLVRAYMAHHQGMGFLAIANLLLDAPMQRRFHTDRRVQATEPLLCERIPASPPLLLASTHSRPSTRATSVGPAPVASQFDTPHTDSPKTLLLCNGSHSVMVTGAGGGYSRWNGIELTRWRADSTRDDWGSFCYLSDRDSGRLWSTAHQPTCVEADSYSGRLFEDHVAIVRQDGDIDTTTEIVVSPEDDVEIRRVTLLNRSGHTVRIEATTYAELSLAQHEADRQHPAFNKLFIRTEVDRERSALLARRRRRHPDEPQVHVAQRLTLSDGASSSFEYETDRRLFIGRGRTLRRPAALDGPLSGSVGLVLDPVFGLRTNLIIEPGQRSSFAIVTAAAPTSGEVLALMDKYGDMQAIERALELAWVNSQLELRQLRIQSDDAQRYQQLAGFLLFPNRRLRPPANRIALNRKPQSALWAYGISGDLPIAVVTIGTARDIGVVRELLLAHTYWRQKGLKADLVILNEASGGYLRPLRDQLVGMIQGNTLHTGVDEPGGVFLRDVDQMPEEDVTLILSVARVALVAARGPIAQQLGAPAETRTPTKPFTTRRRKEEPSSPLPFLPLTFDNGLGGFTEDGREYVVRLIDRASTPAPWANVLANPQFGTLVDESGAGFTWSVNSQRRRITPWSNDPVVAPPAEVIYVRDEDTGHVWSPTASPIREAEGYRARHGTGYTVFEHRSHAIDQELTVWVPMDDDGGLPVRIMRLRLRNDSGETRRLSVTTYATLVLGESREATAPHVVTHWDSEMGILLGHNPYDAEHGGRIAFAALHPRPTSHEADRRAFLGRNGSPDAPAAMRAGSLGGHHGAGLDPCFALQTQIELRPGQHAEVTSLLGDATSRDAAHTIVGSLRDPLAVDESLERTRDWWDARLGAVQVSIPSAAAGFLINRWLVYQTLACRMWGRSGTYQSGGAYGFRDQLQDITALLYTAPELAREHLLRAASRQFPEGDVQHWWHPQSGAGVRTRISDDLLWLPYAVSRYIEVTGDAAILDAHAPFIDSRPLEPGEHEAYLVPAESVEHATLYEHCRRAVERGDTEGPSGLPLIGTGDWNDGMNRVGAGGQGESVWLAWFLCEVLERQADLSELVGHSEEASAYRRRAERLAETVEANAWDGAWYIRATFDDGTPIGSASSVEAKIDSLPQSWATLSGMGEPDRAARALDAAWSRLVLEEEGLALLFDPPFDHWEKDPGYIKGYPPGVRENGGQYTHAAIWLAMALARAGDGERATRLLEMLSPIEHARDEEGVERYGVEPYVVAADVYRLPGRIGRGGWSWYTGSAAWMYRAWLEEVLGLRIRGDRMTLDPAIPSSWDGFSIRYRRGESIYEIRVENPENVSHGVAGVELDGRPLPSRVVPLETHAVKHKVVVRMGQGGLTRTSPRS